MISKELIQNNKKLEALVNRLNEDRETQSIWKAQNVNAIDRLQLTDHGPTHVRIVAENALKILRILESFGISSNVEKDYGMDKEDAEVIVFLASLLHDVGMAVYRDEHEEFSLFISNNLLDKLLPEVYEDVEKRTIVKLEILHAIYTHSRDLKPYTLEASIVKLADGLDMEKGRARIPFKLGAINIHSVSALAIQKVSIEEGNREKPVLIKIKMKNSAGIFQITELLKRKIKGTPLEKYVKIVAEIEGEYEEKILDKFEI